MRDYHIHIQYDPERQVRTFNYDAIEAALREVGASQEEAEALTDILHTEGWGGIEETETRNFTEEELEQKLAWLREHRPVEESLGELTYDLPSGHRALPVSGTSAADVQRAIDNILAHGARNIRWGHNENAWAQVRSEELRFEREPDVHTLELAIERAESGLIEAHEAGEFVAACAGDDGHLVQMHADGTWDVDGDPAQGGLIPAAFMDRAAALIRSRQED